MKILGIGQALVDVFAFVDQGIVTTFGLNSERFNRIPDYKIKAIIATLKNCTKMAGGMPANIVKLSAQMGLSCSFCGCVGTDQEGQLFEKELIDRGVRLFLQKTPGSSGICVIFLTPAQKNNLSNV